jgi:drug/metabolite transporter (DMT)-like permease
MLVAVASFAVMDACLKVMAPHYSAMQIASIRGFASLPVAFGWVLGQGGLGQLVRVRFGLQFLRGILGIIALVTFTYGLRRLALAEAYAIFFIAPLFITLLAALVLKERVGGTRWLAIAVGFVGTLVVLRPTGAGAVTLSGLALLACAAAYAGSAVTVRILGRTDSTPSMVFWTMLLVAVGAGLLAWSDWRPVQQEHWTAILGIGAAGSLGQWGITEAFRRGQASFIAPFEYSALVWGIGLDWTLWRVLPTPITLIGAGIIVSSGLYLIRNEQSHAEGEHP